MLGQALTFKIFDHKVDLIESVNGFVQLHDILLALTQLTASDLPENSDFPGQVLLKLEVEHLVLLIHLNSNFMLRHLVVGLQHHCEVPRAQRLALVNTILLEVQRRSSRGRELGVLDFFAQS
uniref:Uncharacterized protein n=1 Tax=Strombidium inclinatum TaxID=197538 RepID=A0A7S3MV18_9SPIT